MTLTAKWCGRWKVTRPPQVAIKSSLMTFYVRGFTSALQIVGSVAVAAEAALTEELFEVV
jgi:hypothetical protein